MSATKNIFTIYADEDKQVLKYLMLHLQPLEREFHISFWSDTIYTEQRWMPKSTLRLENTDIFVFLVSNAFMYSEFIKQDEFKTIIDYYKANTATVIPILLDDCPWDIEFTSDDYNFSFKELNVFPENRKPIGDWNATDEALEQVTHHFRTLLAPSIKKLITERTNDENEPETLSEKKEKQIAIDFLEEKALKTSSEKKNKITSEVAPEERVQENIIKEEVEAKKASKKEKWLRHKAEIQKRIEEEKRVKEKAKNDAIIDEIVTPQKTEQEERGSDKEAKVKDEVKEVIEVKYAEIVQTKRASNLEGRVEIILAPKTERKKNGFAGQNYQFKKKTAKVIDSSPQEEIPKAQPTRNIKESIKYTFDNSLKPELDKLDMGKVRKMSIILALLVVGVWVVSIVSSDSENQSAGFQEIETTEAGADSDNISENQAAAILELNVGDTYENGIVFAMDSDNRKGKIASLDDSGPMPWQDAIKIHKQLGDGWRLPTLDELQKMYSTIGPGGSNEAEFSDELYWSATPYGEYEARLLRFRNGNTSYHYNKTVPDRQFYVRAVRDFER